MSLTIYAIFVAVLAVVSATAAMIGIGGGVLYTPIQVLFSIDIHQAAATSLFLIIIVSLSGTRIYRRARMVDWSMAIVLEIFTMTGGFAGGYLSTYVPSCSLTIALIAVLAVAGGLMLRANARDHVHIDDDPPWYVWNRAFGDKRYSVNMLIALPLSLIAGAISGGMGIGGGVIKVPMMALLLGIPIDVAIATSLFMVGLTAMAGFTGHLAVGHWNWRMSLILAPAVFIGAWIGAHIMLKFDKKMLKKIFGIAVLTIAVVLVVKMIISQQSQASQQGQQSNYSSISLSADNTN